MLDKETQLRLAKKLFNRTWDLMRLDSRTPDQDDEMLSTAHASAYHWMGIGTDKNSSISQWQLSRVYALLNRPQSAIYHGERASHFAASGDLKPFYHAYGHEAMARGYAVAGQPQQAQEHIEKARELLAAIADQDEKEALSADLATIQL